MTVTRDPAVTVMPLAMIGCVPGVPPAEEGVMIMLPAIKLVLAGKVSETTTLVAETLPLFEMLMV